MFSSGPSAASRNRRHILFGFRARQCTALTRRGRAAAENHIIWQSAPINAIRRRVSKDPKVRAKMAFIRTGRAMGVPLALLAALCIFAQGARGARFVIRNQCSYTVWAAGSPAGGGRRLGPGESWTVEVPAGTTQGRFWGRTGCSFDQAGRGSCRTGDCGGLLACRGYGNIPATLAEYALNQFSNLDFYDISLVDGFNVPLSIIPSNARCPRVLCNRDINAVCPRELKVPDGCKSACAAFNTPRYCCTGPFLQHCDPTDYSRFFKNQCPQAYSYAKDDQTSTFTCPSGTTGYDIVFCGPRIGMSSGAEDI